MHMHSDHPPPHHLQHLHHPYIHKQLPFRARASSAVSHHQKHDAAAVGGRHSHSIRMHSYLYNHDGTRRSSVIDVLHDTIRYGAQSIPPSHTRSGNVRLLTVSAS
jgi:hypothetical protein